MPESARVSLIIIATVLGVAGLYFTRDFAAPMTLGIVVGVIAAPIVDGLKKLHVPEGLAAMLVLVGTSTLLAAVIFALEPLLWRTIDAMPTIERELRELVYQFQGMIRGIEDANEKMKEALGAAAEAGGAGSGDEAAAKEEEGGVTGLPTLSDALFLAPIILGQALIFAATLYFFLVTRLRIYSALSHRLSNRGEASVVVSRFRRAEGLVSRYFATISVINFSLGFALTGYLMAIGMPLPLVWGMAAALLNYVLYVGPAVVAAGLMLAGLISFDGFMAAAPFLGYLCINMTEAQFVTPSLVGKQVSINPLLVFTALVFGLWLWGPIGGIVSIPVMVIAMALADDPASRGQPARPFGRLSPR